MQLRFALFAAMIAFGTLARADDSVETTVDKLWAALANDPGKAADVKTLREIFHPQARIYGVSTKTGQPQLRVFEVKEFIELYASPSAEGFYEREVHRSIDRYEELAQVFSTVESRKDRNAKEPTAIGVNSLQLYKDNGEWRIVTLYYQLEKATAPIPEPYRSNP
ncbi:hypothetical protein HNQ60_001738 [Povalibacter uvarum]|uniref:Nuclear transport factor 2 family protein n=1 Tax=Povalibacter uvarum TaxID=732238 RepID=A0A841HKN6_9GAMM|nr:nuclear transport factor 2 family protein [Povalibacter uvarum]MBB6092860.1 hypothetical protein [Povalibacter uvarum]